MKEKCDQVTSVILKLIQSSQDVEPIVSSINTEALKKVEQIGIKGRVMDEWIDRLKSEGSHLLDSIVKLLMDLGFIQSQMQGIKTTLSHEMEDIGKDMTQWTKMEDFRIYFLIEKKVISTREKYIQTLSLLSHKNEVIRSIISQFDQEKKECDDEIDLISARVADLPCYLYDDVQKLVSSESILQEFLTLIAHLTEHDFSLSTFD